MTVIEPHPITDAEAMMQGCANPTTPQDGQEPAALFTRRGSVAIVTLNRPGARNAVNAALAGAVGTAVQSVAADPDLRVLIITGSGPAFCAGMDLKAYAAGEDVAAPGHPEWGFAGMVRQFIDKPIIAAVNGFAMGGGAELVLACDLVVASSTATLALPEVRRGLIAGAGGLLRLPRKVPRNIAMEIALTGAPLTAQRGLELGLINHVTSPECLLDKSIELAEAIAANAPLAVQATKRLISRGWAYGDDWTDDVWDYNDASVEAILRSEDGLEGARAFAEKRTPVWRGR